jgi:hypothetical protein
VCWAHSELCEPEYHRRVQVNPSAGAYCHLLVACARRCPQARRAACEALRAGLLAVGNANPEKAEKLLSVVPDLLRCGAVRPLLDAGESWAPGADPSLVRAFIAHALSVAQPPYSRPFAAALLRLCGVSNQRRSGALVEQFCGACRAAPWAGELGGAERAALERLCEEERG